MLNAPNIKSTTTLLYLLTTLFVIIFSLVFSQYSLALGPIEEEQKKTHEFLFPKILQLPKSKLTSGNLPWTQLIVRPGNSKQYFASNQTGEIYLFEQGNEQNSHLILDLNDLNKNSKEALRLNAFTLHPNFSIKGSEGYRTFYTAHTENSNKAIATLRIKSHKVKTSLAFEAVITEWQLNLGTLVEVDLSTKREVVRMAIPTIDDSVTQITFDPHRESWDDDFGLLYIGVSSSDSLIDLPLYSGVILRINPNQSDLRSYTIPYINPFISDMRVHDSIFLLGAQKIQQFIWPNRYNKQLLISHHYQNKKIKSSPIKQILTLTNGGEDWRNNPSHRTIFQGKQLLHKHSLFTYLSANSKILRNKILVLQQYQLYSLPFDTQLPESKQEYKQVQLHHELHLPDAFYNSEELLIFPNTDDDLLLLKADIGSVYQLLQTGSDSITSIKIKSDIVSYLVIFIIFIVLALCIFYSPIIRTNSVKSLVRKQYSRITFNDNLGTISLYKRHNKKSDRIIKLANIISCDITLGELVIYTINNSTESNNFNHEQEQALRDIFKREHADKMVSGKVRKISLSLNEANKMSSVTCLYLRKGNDRITKKNYFLVVDELIDWCWFFSQKDERIKTNIPPDLHSEEETKSLHQQAEVIHLAIHSEKLNTELPATTKSKVTPKKVVIEPIENNEKTKDSVKNSMYDYDKSEIQFLTSLEKLVELKQQGFLSLEEFAKAKARLLNRRIDS
jgi:uncharacterized protein YcfL